MFHNPGWGWLHAVPVHRRNLWWQDAEPRRWLGGASAPVDAVGRLPADAPAGAYGVFLSLPDPWRSLGGDGRYSVRLANKETAWEGARGYNALGVSFEVSGAPAPPDPSVPPFEPRARTHQPPT